MSELIVYSKEDCNYCIKAKEFLNNNKIQYKELKLNKNDINDMNIIKDLKEKYNHNTFPFILVQLKNEQDVFIGGYNELQTAYNTMYLHKYIDIEDEYVF